MSYAKAAFCLRFNDLQYNSQFHFGQTNLWNSNSSGKQKSELLFTLTV